MPSFVSNGGIWTPAPERTVIPADQERAHKPEGYIYEGPDRAATAVLAEQQVPSLGIKAEEDPDVIQRARNLGMTVAEFLHKHEPLSKEQKEHETTKNQKVTTHVDQPRKKGVKPQGGRAPSRPESEGGGFGDPAGEVGSKNS